ncbi:MAG: hypothetical protein GX640_02015 [Fibrobacter sp.]|nr:hypothetical protein [Fibrobacter sp.]
MRRALPYLWAVILLIFSGLFCTIRDDNGEPNTPGPNQPVTDTTSRTPFTISLLVSTDSAYLIPGDTLGITVRALQDSQSDTSVSLQNILITATKSHGKLRADSLRTDQNGRCRFYFTDSVPGKIEIQFKAGSVSQTVRFEVTKTPDKIQKLIKATPGRAVIGADGEDTTHITVRIINEFHNPVIGEYVQFITSAGIISGDGSNKNAPGQSLTGPDGVARAVLTSANINDTAYITAYLVSDQSLSDETEVVFRGVQITVNSEKTNLLSGDTTLITVKVTNSSGNTISKVPVFFSLASGSKSGFQLLKADSITNFDGVASARIKAVTNGIDILTINSCGAQTSLQLNSSSLKLGLSLTKSALQTQDTDSAVLEATFSNRSGTLLANKTVKLNRYYKTPQGADTSDQMTKTTDNQGKCRFVIYSLSYEGTMRLEAIAFNASEGYASEDTMIQFFTTRIMTIRSPDFIRADGTSKGVISVFIKNKSGNPIVGDFVTFSTTAGMITSESKTDEDGKAVGYLTSDRRNITATVTATLKSDPTKIQSAKVDFTGLTITASVNPTSISSNGKDTASVLVILTDAAGLPISGERVNFSKQQDATRLRIIDTTTNNRGEARCKVYGTGKGTDTLSVSAAGVSENVVISYSSHVLIIDTASNQSFLANGNDSTLINITYLQGDKTTPIANATVQVGITVGTMDTLFAKVFKSDAKGKVSFYFKNPKFATTATISVIAVKSNEQSSSSLKLYFKANNVKRITLSGTPEVISTNGKRGLITATAYDSTGNRVKDARIVFNLLNGPGGGEYIEPATAITGSDGTATAWIVPGNIPSNFRGVWISAGDFSSIKSDTIKFTIAGPPRYITIRTNMLKGINPNDGTFIHPCAAIVTDVNGNPVADGTEVNFSLKISGYVVSRLSATWFEDISAGTVACNYKIDTISEILPFEDFNDNYKLDPGEDRNGDGMLGRGEDINGDGKYICGPGFIDFNGDGIRQYNILAPAEPVYNCPGGGRRFADLNHNNLWDPIEPLTTPEYYNAYMRLVADSAFHRYPSITSKSDSIDFATLARLDSLYEKEPGFISKRYPFDINSDNNGVADPNTAVSITRTVVTKDGKALNQILYGQTDAGKIEVMLWAESQGVVTLTPEKFVLKVVTDE